MSHWPHLVLIVVLTGCASQKDNFDISTQVSIPATFKPFVSKFVSEGTDQGVPINILALNVEMADNLDTSTEMAVCIVYTPATIAPTIRVSSYYWNQLSQYGKEALLFHELGHCLLGRVHRADTNNGVPLSDMYAYFLGDTLYLANYTQYMYEMFHAGIDLANQLPMKTSGNEFANADMMPASKSSAVAVLNTENNFAGWKCDHE